MYHHHPHVFSVLTSGTFVIKVEKEEAHSKAAYTTVSGLTHSQCLSLIQIITECTGLSICL